MQQPGHIPFSLQDAVPCNQKPCFSSNSSGTHYGPLLDFVLWFCFLCFFVLWVSVVFVTLPNFTSCFIVSICFIFLRSFDSAHFESRSIPPMNQIPLAAFEFSAVPLLLQRLLPSVHAQRFRSTHFSSNGAFQPITATYFLTKLDQGFLSPACSISTHFKACSRAESTVLGCSSRVSDRPRAIVYAHQLAVAKS